MVLEQYLEEDGSLIIEIDLWYPKNVHEEKSLKIEILHEFSIVVTIEQPDLLLVLLFGGEWL